MIQHYSTTAVMLMQSPAVTFLHSPFLFIIIIF